MNCWYLGYQHYVKCDVTVLALRGLGSERTSAAVQEVPEVGRLEFYGTSLFLTWEMRNPVPELITTL